MPIDPKQADAYVRQAIQQFLSDPQHLTEHERRLIRKYQKYNQVAQQAAQDAEQLRSQLRQGEARLRTVELQIADAQGKAEGFIEYLISSKFEDESSADETMPSPVIAEPKSNGKKTKGSSREAGTHST